MNKKVIYIAGKIGTYDIDKVSKKCYEKFADAEMELRLKYPNCEVFNPLEFAKSIAEQDVIFQHVEIPFKNLTAKQRKRYISNMNIRAMLNSTSIYLLTDWRSSAGALFEKDIADFLGLEIIYQKEKEE